MSNSNNPNRPAGQNVPVIMGVSEEDTSDTKMEPNQTIESESDLGNNKPCNPTSVPIDGVSSDDADGADDADDENDILQKQMGFSQFGATKAPKRKHNPGAGSFVDGQDSEGLDRGGKRGKGTGGNNQPLGKARVLGKARHFGEQPVAIDEHAIAGSSDDRGTPVGIRETASSGIRVTVTSKGVKRSGLAFGGAGLTSEEGKKKEAAMELGFEGMVTDDMKAFIPINPEMISQMPEGEKRLLLPQNPPYTTGEYSYGMQMINETFGPPNSIASLRQFVNPPLTAKSTASNQESTGLAPGGNDSPPLPNLLGSLRDSGNSTLSGGVGPSGYGVQMGGGNSSRGEGNSSRGGRGGHTHNSHNRNQQNPLWYQNYYDPASNQNPWEWSESKLRLDSEGTWLEKGHWNPNTQKKV